MSATTIGIQTIMPQTGTGPQQTPPPSGNDSDSNDAVAAASTQKPPPPPPGMGKYVDKLA